MRPLPILLILAVIAALVFTFKSLNNDKGPAVTAPDNDPVVEVDDPAVTDPDLDSPDGVRRVAEGPRPLVGTPQDTPDSKPLPGAGSAVSGRVLNDRGEPVVGAEVMLSEDAMTGEALSEKFFFSGADQQTPSRIDTVSTDAQGQYRFDEVHSGKSFYLGARHADYRLVQTTTGRLQPSVEKVMPDLVISAGAVFEGYVSDVANNPVGDAAVHLDSVYMLGYEYASPDRVSTLTDPSGYFRIENVPVGIRRAAIEAEGYASHLSKDIEFRDDASQTEALNFRLEIATPIGGDIVGPEGEPVVGAEVWAILASQGENSCRGRAVSDETGRFLINGLRNGVYRVTVLAPGYVDGGKTGVQSGEVALHLELKALPGVRGIALGSDGAPLANFSASLRTVDPSRELYSSVGQTWVFEDAEEGAFQVPAPNPGEYVVVVEAPGYAPTSSEPVQVHADGPLSEVTVTMGAGGTLTGRVLGADGAAVSGAQVSTWDHTIADDPFLGIWDTSMATRATTTTGSDGTFTLSNLHTASYRLFVSHAGHAPTVTEEILVDDGSTAQAGDLQLSSGGTVEGFVLDTDGQALGNAVVYLIATEGQQRFEGRSDSEGQYRIENVRAGTYLVIAPGPVMPGFTPSRDQVDVSDGQSARMDLTRPR